MLAVEARTVTVPHLTRYRDPGGLSSGQILHVLYREHLAAELFVALAHLDQRLGRGQWPCVPPGKLDFAQAATTPPTGQGDQPVRYRTMSSMGR